MGCHKRRREDRGATSQGYRHWHCVCSILLAPFEDTEVGEMFANANLEIFIWGGPGHEPQGVDSLVDASQVICSSEGWYGPHGRRQGVSPTPAQGR
eukprot:4284190-Pyramimonas_sp.AAC.1